MQADLKKYGLIGKALEHSFSQKYFQTKFEHLGIHARYDNISLQSVEEVVDLFKKNEYAGFNVTMPYKESIIPYLDRLDDQAAAVGAVNTILVEGGKTVGYNTDVYGFKQMIKPFFESHHERALIIGTGGASKAVAFVLEALGVQVIYVSRRPNGKTVFGYEDVNENMVKFNGIIVNTTPVGMHPDDKAEVVFPYSFLTDKHLVVDLIYNPLETVFLKKAKQQGAVTQNGLTMLHQQAEKAWQIWTN